ncbi:hypothetical protein COLSTE_02451 [Collinsella stercoris DSM 13279]|uniref:Uncharacterized protein n=1 Tax=Collinsella stercoris DSM 13279 TaxID=445975 RepID=B6GEB4_9ACTN|nr:hypothetical protein COLSTE_02451 [Collinsella stercoris DSM 13279]
MLITDSQGYYITLRCGREFARLRQKLANRVLHGKVIQPQKGDRR